MLSYRVYCLCGDGETAEGSIWEAMAFASYYKLDNLVNIIDINRLGQSQETMYQHDIDVYKKRVEAFGWHALVVDGHDVKALVDALNHTLTVKGQPCCILAKTFKGQSFLDLSNSPAWHGKPLGKHAEGIIKSLRESIKDNTDKLASEILPIQLPKQRVEPNNISNVKLSKAPAYKLGQEVATRLAYGDALVKLGESNTNVVALDGDVKNSTFSIKFRDAFPDRFIECFIAEQNLAGVAIGVACRDRKVAFASTFSAFWSRAFDQIRMGAISQTNVNFCGSHVGCSIGGMFFGTLFLPKGKLKEYF